MKQQIHQQQQIATQKQKQEQVRFVSCAECGFVLFGAYRPFWASRASRGLQGL